MLAELYIRNLAIIDELRMRFGPGLTVLTGETGAGKSIIVDAVAAALGQRVGSEVVRTGADQAVVEAVFDLGLPGGSTEPLPSEFAALLSDHGLEIEDGLLILSREVNRASGRTVARVNGRPVPLSLLQRVGQFLVDIHGQSEHLSLLRVREHVDYLDRYAGLMDARDAVAREIRELRSVRRDVDQTVRDEREAAREIDLLSYQIQEIRSANLVVDEEDQLAAERLRLRNAELLRDLSQSAHRLMSGGAEQGGAVDLLAQAERLYSELARLDPGVEAERQSLESARYAIEEVARHARTYAGSVEDDEQRLNQVEERLDLLARLKRKYGRTVAEVVSYCEEADARLQKLVNRAQYLEGLRQAEGALLERVGQLASALSRDRKTAAMGLKEDVQRELGALGMAATRFEVAFSVAPDPNGVPCDLDGRDARSRVSTPQVARDPAELDRVAFDTTGVDRVEFLVSPNPGEEPKPLARIASGGETARLMLALKTILCNADAIPTLVFDEIDVGVGARSGVRVGEKLWGLTEAHQVLCITHMAQIACMADQHISVAKIVDGGRTRTSVSTLREGQRVEELAAMLAGTSELAPALASAEALLRRATEAKGRSMVLPSS